MPPPETHQDHTPAPTVWKYIPTSQQNSPTALKVQKYLHSDNQHNKYVPAEQIRQETYLYY
jgi:hypothetical protein